MGIAFDSNDIAQAFALVNRLKAFLRAIKHLALYSTVSLEMLLFSYVIKNQWIKQLRRQQ